MAQRIGRAKRTLRGRGFRELGDSRSCSGSFRSSITPVTAAGTTWPRGPIRLTRQLTLATPKPRRAACSH